MGEPLCLICKETGEVPLECLFKCQRGEECEKARPVEAKPQVGDHCRRCGATDVHWITVTSREEARFHFKQTGRPSALRLGTPRLFNWSGGEHQCPTTADGFEDEPV